SMPRVACVRPTDIPASMERPVFGIPPASPPVAGTAADIATPSAPNRGSGAPRRSRAPSSHNLPKFRRRGLVVEHAGLSTAAVPLHGTDFHIHSGICLI